LKPTTAGETLDVGAIATDAQIADAVCDEALSGHTTAGTVGKAISDTNTKAASLTFTVAGQVDANIQYVNDVAVTGNGQPGTEWGP
jgi:hypothetical protein